MKTQKTVFSPDDIKRVITRIAHEIIEKHKGVQNLALIGIQTRGVYLAQRLASEIQTIERSTIPVGDMDINMYRDDWTKISHQPIVRPSNIQFNVDEKDIILVDDVLFTGRTIRAAMDALMDYGRPARIELAVLVDRGHRELPIQADYKGIMFNTDHTSRVNVLVTEHDKEDGVYVES